MNRAIEIALHNTMQQTGASGGASESLLQDISAKLEPPIAIADGAPVPGIALPSGGSKGLIGWLSLIADTLINGFGLFLGGALPNGANGVLGYLSAIYGSPITGSALPAGGLGNQGWLSLLAFNQTRPTRSCSVETYVVANAQATIRAGAIYLTMLNTGASNATFQGASQTAASTLLAGYAMDAPLPAWGNAEEVSLNAIGTSVYVQAIYPIMS